MSIIRVDNTPGEEIHECGECGHTGPNEDFESDEGEHAGILVCCECGYSDFGD